MFGLLFHCVIWFVSKIEESGDGDCSVGVGIASQTCCSTRNAMHILTLILSVPNIQIRNMRQSSHANRSNRCKLFRLQWHFC